MASEENSEITNLHLNLGHAIKHNQHSAARQLLEQLTETMDKKEKSDGKSLLTSITIKLSPRTKLAANAFTPMILKASFANKYAAKVVLPADIPLGEYEIEISSNHGKMYHEVSFFSGPDQVHATAL